MSLNVLYKNNSSSISLYKSLIGWKKANFILISVLSLLILCKALLVLMPKFEVEKKDDKIIFDINKKISFMTQKNNEIKNKIHLIKTDDGFLKHTVKSVMNMIDKSEIIIVD